MNLTQTKNIFFKILIGCLVAAATLAVVTVLLGAFNEVCQKALFTILLVALHALAGVSFITNNEKQDTFESLAFFTNATFSIIVLSFATSVLGVWGIIPGDFVGKLYAFYFVLLFAILHGEVLAKAQGKQAIIDKLIAANYVFMVVVVALLVPVIFVGTETFGSLYYRLLAACGIVDATLTLVAVLLHRLYVLKHPQIVDPVFGGQSSPAISDQSGQNIPSTAQQAPRRGMNIFVGILMAYVALQVFGALFLLVVGSLSR